MGMLATELFYIDSFTNIHQLDICNYVFFIAGPNDPDKFITSDDNSGDGKNAKIKEALIPDSDYYVVVRVFDPDGGEFNLSVTAV